MAAAQALAEIKDLRKAAAEQLHQIAQLNNQVFVLQRVVLDLAERYNHHTHEKQNESYEYTQEPDQSDKITNLEELR